MHHLVPGSSDFFTQHIATFFNEEYPDAEAIDRCREWTLANTRWRMFFVVFEMLETDHYKVALATGSTLLDKVAEVFSSILKGSADAKNFNVKTIVFSQLFKQYVNRTLSLPVSKKTIRYLAVAQQAIATTWQTKEDTTKQLSAVLKIIN